MTKAGTDTIATADARLLQLGAEMSTLNKRQDALWQQGMDATTEVVRDAACEAASAGTDRYHGILQEMQHTPARTRKCEQVKARVILRWLLPEGEVRRASSDGIVAWLLAQEVLRSPSSRQPVGAASSDAGSALDAELIATCDEIADLNSRAEALDDVDEANVARWMELKARALTMPAETVEGPRTRLRSIGKDLLAHDVVGTSTGDARSHFVMAAQDLWRLATGSMGALRCRRTPS